MITIAKRFTFDAAHRLSGLPDTHKCHRMHGHTYTVEIGLYGYPDHCGMLVDYQDIADSWAPLNDALDHRILNEVPGLEVPTTERLVVWIFDRLTVSEIGKYLSFVRVHESSSTWAEVKARDYKRWRGVPSTVQP